MVVWLFQLLALAVSLTILAYKLKSASMVLLTVMCYLASIGGASCVMLALIKNVDMHASTTVLALGPDWPCDVYRLFAIYALPVPIGSAGAGQCPRRDKCYENLKCRESCTYALPRAQAYACAEFARQVQVSAITLSDCFLLM